MKCMLGLALLLSSIAYADERNVVEYCLTSYQFDGDVCMVKVIETNSVSFFTTENNYPAIIDVLEGQPKKPSKKPVITIVSDTEFDKLQEEKNVSTRINLDNKWWECIKDMMSGGAAGAGVGGAIGRVGGAGGAVAGAAVGAAVGGVVGAKASKDCTPAPVAPPVNGGASTSNGNATSTTTH